MPRGDKLLVVALAALLAAGCGSGRGPSVAPSAQPSVTVTAAVCHPRVVESGFSDSSGYIWFGLIVENPCDQATVNNLIDVTAQDAHGATLSDPGKVLGLDLPVVLPGQRTGVTGEITLPAEVAATVTFLQVAVVSNELRPAAAFAKWPKSVTAEQVKYDPLAGAGLHTMTFRLHPDPAGTQPCHPFVHVIMRDAAGKIVYGRQSKPVGLNVTLDVTPPAGTDLGKTEIYVLQGDDVLGFGADAEAHCQ